MPVMNPLSTWLFFVGIFQAARLWDKRLAKRRAQFASFMRKVFTSQDPKD
jgi:hypothetical protein